MGQPRDQKKGLPEEPSSLVEDRGMTQQERLRLTSIRGKNLQMAEWTLSDGKGDLMGKGFSDEQVKTVYLPLLGAIY